MALEPLTPERRRAMTRQHLLEAAAIVFSRKGFRGATLDEVATTAGFTKGAVYSNFDSKDDLFQELLDDRIDRQFAVVAEIVEGSDAMVDQLARIRDLLLRGAFLWDNPWETLYLEFVLYARDNPEAAEKLKARAERERLFTQEMIEHELGDAGVSPRYPTRELATVQLAMFGGLALARLVDPDSVTQDTVDTALRLISDVIFSHEEG